MDQARLWLQLLLLIKSVRFGCHGRPEHKFIISGCTGPDLGSAAVALGAAFKACALIKGHWVTLIPQKLGHVSVGKLKFCIPTPRLRKISPCTIPASARRVGDIIKRGTCGPCSASALPAATPLHWYPGKWYYSTHELAKSQRKYYSKQILLLRN